MRIILHIGLPNCGAEPLQAALADKRERLATQAVLYPRTPGRSNHTRLFMAMSDSDHIDPLRWSRGFASAQAQRQLRDELRRGLRDEIAAARPQTLILSASQLGASLHRQSELARLRDFLHEFSDDIRLIAHVQEQSRALVHHYGSQILDGRTRSLAHELSKLDAPDWRAAALEDWAQMAPGHNDMPEVQGAPFWLDYGALCDSWEAEFGTGALQLRSYDAQVFHSPDLAGEIDAAFGLSRGVGKISPSAARPAPSAATLARARAMNRLFAQALRSGRRIRRPLWRRLLKKLEWDGPPIDPASLAAVSGRFAKDNAALLRRHPALDKGAFAPPPAGAPWQEAAPEGGFRATQYFTVFLPIIDSATREELQGGAPAPGAETAPATPATPAPSAALPPLALANFNKLAGGRFAPHNNIGRVNEAELAAQYAPVPARKLPAGNSGNVIVGCMKNEGPYIVEWVAYHRAIGIDNFIIYTNGCEDRTSEILDRLQDMGHVQHRNNDAWKGNSPQQYALNQSLKEPLIRNAEWVIHIDVDEFINVRCGNGTVADFLERVPEATNVAMTWRMFGHNGVVRFEDRPVIGQFDSCAPKYCPKPHTVWGFKTMVKNIGAYEKLSCHRPNKLIEAKRDKVLWVNGSGQPMGEAVKERGWRSELRSVGYDLIQLNHYALRSAESFLIKRQRGRALHVDRSIGLNYWVRMDWSDHKDLTIQRNLDRLNMEMSALLGDPKLAALHRKAVDWHRAKAAELRDVPEFRELLQQALDTQLTEMERVAYALALDMES